MSSPSSSDLHPASPSPTPGPTSSFGATLPPEVLDSIFKFYFSSKKRKSEPEGVRKDVALVCRSWRGPAQRYLFQSFTIDCVIKLRDFGREKTYLGQHIQKLTINVTVTGDR